jgi:hypothetical protein
VPVTTEFTTGNYIAATERGLKSRTVQVPSIRLDDYWRDAGKPQVGFVKVDVEGAEWSVLDGARDLLMNCRPRLLLELVDEWLRRFNKTRQDCLTVLEECGYRRARTVAQKEEWHTLSTFRFTSEGNYIFEA